MIRSMTGYGRGENEAHDRKFTVEIKSVNHRYNDITIKLPRSMNYLEDKIRKILMQYIFRGKTDVYITFESFSKEDISVTVNENLAAAYVERLQELEDKYQLSSNDSLGLVARFPDVIVQEHIEEDAEQLWNTLLPALEGAANKFVAMREAEGAALMKDIQLKAEQMKTLVDEVQERSPVVAEEYREKLKNRLNELLDTIEIDEQRLAAEAAILADRSCIDEEITRLYSHIEQLQEILSFGGQVGRKLDFLVQEFNREANTIASKANDIQITKATIELKSEIEKIREQVQNIE